MKLLLFSPFVSEIRISAVNCPVNGYLSGRTGPEKSGNSPVELLKKYIHFAVSFCQKMFHEYCYQVYEILCY
jgi:hypothetical protein